MRSIMCLMATMVSMVACNTGVEVDNGPLKSLMGNDLIAIEELLWEDPSNIQVCWETPESYSSDELDPNLGNYVKEKQWVRKSIEDSWSAANPIIRFVGWGDCDKKSPGIRIKVFSDAGGPTAFMGRHIDGKEGGMKLSFDLKALVEAWEGEFVGSAPWAPCLLSEENRKACIEAAAVHEFGHALGLRHEQDRSDVSSPCDYDTYPYYPGSGVVPGTYDPRSIMNYCRENRFMDWELSPGDKEGILALYPPPGYNGGGTVSDWGRPDVIVDGNGVLRVGEELVLLVRMGPPTGYQTEHYRVGLPPLEPPPFENAVEVVSSDKSKVVLSGDGWELSSYERDGTPVIVTRVRFTPSVAGDVEFYWHGRFVKKLTIL